MCTLCLLHPELNLLSHVLSQQQQVDVRGPQYMQILTYAVMLPQARKQPTSQAQVVEYLLSTETGEMQYETARCRPHLDQSFFAYLDSQIGESNAWTTELHASCTVY